MRTQNTMKDNYTTRSAVLFICFNRKDAAQQVFDAIKAAKTPRLYFACDGARTEEEWDKCNDVRGIVDQIDWDCEVKTKFSDVNLGVKMGESTAMEWFFQNEEEGIILEDDTYPDNSFFRFCDEMLEKYRNDERIWNINGNNLMMEWEHDGKESYYFSQHGYGAYWGWASWRRVWNKYDVEMKEYPAARDTSLLEDHFLSKAEKKEAYKLFDLTLSGEISSWDYQMDFARIANNGHTIIPNSNLITNIGFGAEGTHTVNENDPRNNKDLQHIEFPLVHPKDVHVDEERDLQYFQKYVLRPFYRRFKNKIKAALPNKVDEAITPALGKIQKKMGLNG